MVQASCGYNSLSMHPAAPVLFVMLAYVFLPVLTTARSCAVCPLPLVLPLVLTNALCCAVFAC